MVGKIFRVLFSSKSRDRLKDITNYQRRNTFGSVANNTRKAIREEAQKLEKLPSSRPIYPGTEDMNGEIRYTKKWSYKIIFEVFSAKKLVQILTIRHDAEDPEDILDDLQ